MARPAAQPRRIGLGVLIAHIDHRAIATAPASVVRPIAAAATTGDAGIPLSERHFVFADRKGLAH